MTVSSKRRRDAVVGRMRGVSTGPANDNRESLAHKLERGASLLVPLIVFILLAVVVVSTA